MTKGPQLSQLNCFLRLSDVIRTLNFKNRDTTLPTALEEALNAPPPPLKASAVMLMCSPAGSMTSAYLYFSLKARVASSQAWPSGVSWSSAAVLPTKSIGVPLGAKVYRSCAASVLGWTATEDIVFKVTNKWERPGYWMLGMFGMGGGRYRVVL